MKFTELAGSLKENLFPIYVLEGEEVYFSDHAVESIKKACALSRPALNETCVDGETLKGDKLIDFCDSLYTLPFFDERRFVRVNEFHPTEREWESVFQKYVENPCLSTVLVVVNHGKKPNTTDFKKKKKICYVDCSRADEETLIKWLFGLLRRAGLSADTDAVARIVRYCALDAARIKKETEKLLLLLGAGGKVTREIVEEHVERDIEYKIYELTQASSRGDFTAFTEISTDLLRKGSDEGALLSALCAHYKTLLQIASLKNLSEAEAAQKTGLKPYAIKKNRELIARLGVEKIKARFVALHDLLAEIRSGNQTKSGAFTAGIAKIFFE